MRPSAFRLLALLFVLAIGTFAVDLHGAERSWRPTASIPRADDVAAARPFVGPVPASDLHNPRALPAPPMGTQRRFVPIVEEGLPEDERLPRSALGGWTDEYPETGITFLEYVTSRPLRPTPARRTIVLVPAGGFRDTRTLEAIAPFVSAYFQLPVRVHAGLDLPDRVLTGRHRRADADAVLLALQSRLPRDAFVMTAVTHVDLYSGRLSGVFGLSYSDLNTSMVSTARIWAERDHASSAEERLRLAKLVVHEICHNLGFPHCAAHRCRMNGTMGFRDLEEAPITLCGPCLHKLEWNLGFDHLTRFRNVRTALRDLRCGRDAYAYAERIARIEATPDRNRVREIRLAAHLDD